MTFWAQNRRLRTLPRRARFKAVTRVRCCVPSNRPADLAKRLARASERRRLERDSAFRRVTFSLPRAQARAKAREFFAAFPKAAYMTEVESWRELPGDVIEFTMRRLPTAD